MGFFAENKNLFIGIASFVGAVVFILILIIILSSIAKKHRKNRRKRRLDQIEAEFSNNELKQKSSEK